MKKILFISRGKGWGHTVRDLAIIKALTRLRQDIEPILATYQDGIQCIQKNAIDNQMIKILPISENEDSRIDDILSVIAEELPSLIISDEEYEAARIDIKQHIPVYFLTNYLTNREMNLRFRKRQYPCLTGF